MSHDAPLQIITPSDPDRARILKALFYGWATVSGMGFLGLIAQLIEAEDHVSSGQFSSGFAIVLIGSFTGLSVFGAPAWWLLHTLGCRRQVHAIGLGAVLGAGALLALVWHATGFQGDEATPLAPVQWLRLGLATIYASAASALAGAVIWRTAYR